MFRKLIIAEKPSVAQALAEGLGTPQKKYTHYEVADTVVVWLYGHILRLYNADEYDPKYLRWNEKDLPILPNPFALKPIVKKDDERYSRQLEAVRKYAEECDIIYNAGDPDREGHTLVCEVLDYLGVLGNPKKQFFRILPNAVDPATIRRVLNSPEPHAKYDRLYDAGRGRAYNDWLLGINLTRAVTTMLVRGKGLASIGRVQTPTLGLVVARDDLIANFVPQFFWNLVADVSTASGTVTLTFAPKDEEKRIWKEELANEVIAKLQGKTVTLAVDESNKTKSPPDLCTLPSLQRDCNRLWKWSATKTLSTAQALYDLKLLSYPRTECKYLPTEQAKDVPTISAIILKSGCLPNTPGIETLLKPRSSVFDSSKVEEHHAIVPTMMTPNFSSLTNDQRLLWGFVAKQYMMMLLPDYRYKSTEMSFVESGYAFSTKGEIPLNAKESWLLLGSAPTAVLLPNIANGQQGVVQSAKTKKGETTPPKPYTEGTLITDMGAVAKYVTDPKLKAILKETSGIGTAATQAATIELIKHRQFVEETSEGNLVSTPFGRALIGALPKTLYDPGLTAIVEDALKDVHKGELPLSEFMTRSERYVDKRVNEIRNRRGHFFLVVPAADAPSARKAEPKKAGKKAPAKKAEAGASGSKPAPAKASSGLVSGRRPGAN